MAVGMMKDIFLHIVILSFLWNISFATDNNFNSVSVYKKYYKKLEDKKQTSEYRKGVKKIIDYVPLKINFDKNEVKKVYEKWKKDNTGTYVCIGKPTFTNASKAMHFIKNNSIVKYVELGNLKYKTNADVQDINNVKMKEDIFNIPAIPKSSYCLIDNIFKKALVDLPKSSEYDCLEYDLIFDTNYNYITALRLGRVQKVDYINKRKYFVPCERRPKPLHSDKGFFVHIYGLMMLPKETKYTDRVVEKILSKYEQAWECEKKLLASKKIKSEQNLTMLEKAVGKEKLECLDKYLIWDENVSK